MSVYAIIDPVSYTHLGDSLMQSHLLTYNFTDSRFLLRKVLQDFADSQLIPGFFPFVAPGSYWNPTFQLRMSEYDFDYVEILWQLYWYFDDQDAIRQFYPVASRMMGYYLGIRTADGLIPKEEGIFHISDLSLIHICEDIGLAYPQGITIVKSCVDSAVQVGLPERCV